MGKWGDEVLLPLHRHPDLPPLPWNRLRDPEGFLALLLGRAGVVRIPGGEIWKHLSLCVRALEGWGGWCRPQPCLIFAPREPGGAAQTLT